LTRQAKSVLVLNPQILTLFEAILLYIIQGEVGDGVEKKRMTALKIEYNF
jgi:hypothetical protein